MPHQEAQLLWRTRQSVHGDADADPHAHADAHTDAVAYAYAHTLSHAVSVQEVLVVVFLGA
jgi:hypothetical protein